jgi:type II secretory pathway pseudopilin PulG
MTTSDSLPPNRFAAFSLVEVLAAITIIGIITFLAVPNIVRVKQDSEENLARARAETLNMAIASYVQAKGTNAAQTAWTAAANDNARYTNCLINYIAFPDTDFSSFTPAGYKFSLPSSIVPMSAKTTISNTNTAQRVYY